MSACGISFGTPSSAALGTSPRSTHPRPTCASEMRISQLPRGVTELEVEANNFRRLILQLDRRFPGLGHQIDEGGGDRRRIYQDAYLASLQPESEISI